MEYINIKVDKEQSTKQLLRKNDFSTKAILEILNNGYLINNKITYKNSYLNINDQVKIEIPKEELDYQPIKANINIIYEDDHILVIDKAYGITVNSKNQVSLANHISYYFKENGIKSKIRFINRLDMNTSGLLMVAKNKFAQSFYQKQIETNQFNKYYIAAVKGNLDIDREVKVYLSYDEKSKRYEVKDKGKLAITYFKTKACSIDRKVCFIMADIRTGKTHQIRSSLSYLGFPIIGDTLYGSDIDFNRFFLHCYQISFRKFLSKETISLNAMPNFTQLNNLLWKLLFENYYPVYYN